MVELKRLWSGFVTICVVVAFLLVSVTYLPRIIGIKTFVVTSGSMEPKLPVGSLIYVDNVSPDEINVGDAITFYIEGTDIIATHQVYEIDKEQRLFRTQGINNKDENGEILKDVSPVSYSSLIGKQIGCIPFVGSINEFCTTAPGYYIMACVVFAIIAISVIFDLFSKPQQSETDENSNRENQL